MHQIICIMVWLNLSTKYAIWCPKVWKDKRKLIKNCPPWDWELHQHHLYHPSPFNQPKQAKTTQIFSFLLAKKCHWSPWPWLPRSLILRPGHITIDKITDIIIIITIITIINNDIIINHHQHQQKSNLVLRAWHWAAWNVHGLGKIFSRPPWWPRTGWK